MGTGDYFCVTLRGGAPWGFTLQEGDGDTYRPFIVSQVDEGGRAFLAGVQEGDEVVSLNGEPCADLSLLRARASIDTTVSCLQLLLKRTLAQEEYESEEAFCGQMDSSDAAFESTTLHIITPKNGTQASRQLHISESYEEVESDGDAEFLKGPQLLSTTLHVPSSGDDRDGEPGFKEHEEAQLCFSPGELVELQVSLSEQTLDDVTCTSLGSALGIQGELSTRETTEMIQDPATSTSTTTTTSLSAPCPVRQPLGQHGVVLSSPSMLGQVEVILQQQPAAASGAGRSLLIPDDPGEEGGCSQEDAGSFTVSFVIPPEETTPAEEQDSDSEVDQGKPNKHHARHARLRRSESLSEKQVKEAKSKCKRIALLLTAAPPNPNNKGVLMFKKHRLRAKKYTLVSYGTGEDEPEYSDEEDGESEDDKEETHTVEFTLVAPRDSEIEKHILENSSKGVLTINWDKGLLEIERNLNNQAEMECLPETKGKGAVMFAQRRLRMDEIAAEHEELRRQGIPVEGVQEVEEKVAEQSYLQCTTEGHAYMDVNMHQQSQQQQQYQQYQEQQYHEQQQHYQQEQQQHQTQYQQQYEQQHYQQQQMYQQQQQRQQQEYHDQQQMQLYSTNVNGTVHHQTSEMQSSCSNRTAKPFLVDNLAPALYSPAVSCVNQDSVGQGEQIASRDERISTPAIKTGVLSDARKRNTGKPMFTFKEAPKISPNPALLNLLNRNNKKLGFESGPEEDYLSLGAEACNFLQSPMKNKVPPPVAPKPMINSSSVQLSPQLEVSNQDIPQQAENSVSTPAVAPATDDHPAPELQPTPAPAPEPTPPPAPQEVPASTTTMEQHTWAPSEPEPQQQAPQVTTQEELGHMNSTIQPETAPVTSWAAAQTHVQPQPSTNLWQKQPQEPTPSPPPPQPSWATCQPTQTQAQSEIPTNTWTHQNQPSWKQQQDQAQAQTNAQPSWTQPQEQTQPQPPMAHHHEQQNLQQMQPTWGQPQDKLMQQQPQAPWAQPQTHSQPQPPWMQQPQQKSGAQPSWVQQIPSDSQQQLPWAQQPERQAPQQVWPQPQALEQPQPPWISAQPQQQLPINAWPPSQTQVQVQPPWIQPSQAQPPPQPQVTLNPWAPVPAQDPVQPSWAQHPSENCQQPMGSWAQEQNVAQHQPPWAQQVPPHPIPQPNWQQSTPDTSSQPPMNIMPPAPTQPQASVWGPQSQQKPVNVSTPMVNTHPSPKPWHPPQNAPQNRSAPPAPQRMHSFAITQRASSPINPMATVLNPSSQGSSLDMPTVRGKGADMFAKRQSRMEKFIVDSDTVEANKASRSTSPAASLPNEWKYTPNVRAPPSRSYNPIQSPFYPPAAIKQPPSSSPSTKATKKGKDKQKPAPKPLSVVDVMKHQPYQLSSSLFIYGPAAETEKSPAPKPECSPPNPPIENQAVRYGQMAPTQPTESFNAPYPQQAYGMPMQPMVQDGHYQQNPANVYPQPNPYQQPPGGIYQQAYNHQYQQPVPPAYHPQALQSPNLPYHQAAQPPYQPANSPPYLATPSVLQYQPQPPSSYVAPSFPFAARPESASGGSGGSSAAPKPKFTANKSSAQAFGRSYSLSPQARLPYTGQRSASASSSPKPPARASTTSWLERGHKPLSPWQAASRHPLGLVDEAFAYQDLQHTLASNVCLAAQRKTLPEPPAEWKARVSYQAPEKRGSYTWSQSQTRSQSRPPLPSFVTPTGSTVSTESSPAGFGSLPRQWIQNQTCSPRRAPLPSFVPPTRSTVSPAASPAGYGSLPRQWIQSQTRSQSRASLPSFVPPTRSTISPADSPAGYGSLPRQWIQSQTRSQSRASLPSFVPPTRSTISPADSPARYGSLPRQWQPQRSVAGANPGTSVSYPEYKTPVGKQTYKSVFTSNTWSWRR